MSAVRRRQHAKQLDYDGIRLDVGCGESKQAGFIGMDRRAVPGVDIVHDIEELPWPLRDSSCTMVLFSHVMEHLKPWLIIDVFNEMWRVLRPGPEGRLFVAVPYANSYGGHQDPTHCYYPDTEVLTDTGFKLISDVRLGENLLVLNPSTQATKFSPCIDTVRVQYDGDLLHFLTRRMDLLVTPNHQMLWAPGGEKKDAYEFNVSPAEDFARLRGHHSRRGLASLNWSGSNPKEFSLPRRDTAGHGKSMPTSFSMETFCRFMGWYLSGGSTTVDQEHNEYRVSIHQVREVYPENYAEIVEVITGLGMTPQTKPDRVSFCSRELAEFLAPLGHSHEKYIPMELKALAPPLLRFMIDSLVKGDGTPNGNGWEYASVSPQLASDVHEIALKSGFRSSLHVEHRPPKTKIMGREVNARDIYLVGGSPPADLYYPKPTVLPYKGEVVCVTAAESHIIYVRRNGRAAWCGNTRPGFNEATFHYFCPFLTGPGGKPVESTLYNIYKPKPFKIVAKEIHEDAYCNVVLEPLKRLDGGAVKLRVA